jgi:uncharacterized membrane protein
MQFWQFLGDLHPRLVQFPLVLLLAGLIFDAAGLLSRSPRCPFATTFPKPGLYKLWAQFKRNGQMSLVSFVIEVKPPILPPNVIRFLLDD